MEFSTEPVVSMKDGNIFYDDKIILKDINFDISKGEFVYLIGRTGSGKSTLLKTIYADIPVKEGKLKVAGYEVDRVHKSDIPYLRRKIGVIFQDFQLFPDRTVNENLLFVMKATGWKDSAHMKRRLADVLMLVGLGALSSKMPHQLSGGEQQRVVVARALINEPLILVADEPTGNLDPEVAEGILSLFRDINKSGTAILMATHNHFFLDKHPARVLKIEHGRLYDSSKEIFSYGHEN